MKKSPAQICPMWFWNARLDADEIRWQVARMAEQGVRGFYIHPRQGMDTPYLSEAFFGAVKAALEAAREHGLKVHLYDEYPYPSGVAGGAVILGEPRFGATRLEFVSESVAGGIVRLELPAGKILSCVAVPEDSSGMRWGESRDLMDRIGVVLARESYNETGLTTYNRKRYFASGPTPTLEVELPSGKYRIITAAQVEVRDFKYWGRYVDVLNPDAVERFIELTHERYRRHCGEDFGGLIESTFIDETEPWWTPTLPETFYQEYGYDLPASMPALAEPGHPDHARVKADFERLRYRLFCEIFESRIGNWCREHRLAYGGEKPSFRLAQLRFMDIPGCEPGHTKAGAPLDIFKPRLRSNGRSTASAAYFYGKADALCECYHSMGWAATLQDAKLVADGLLLAGITRLVPHGFFYSTHALRKHDAPPSFFYQMPYWPKFHLLSRHVEAVGNLFDGTWIDAEIAIVDPGSGVPDNSEREIFGKMMNFLLERHLDFHLVDTDILEDGKIGDGTVRLRDVSIKAILLPPMKVVEKPLARWLARFEAAGGLVVRVFGEEDMAVAMERVTREIKPSIRVSSGGIGEESGVYTAHRRGPAKEVWFILNVSDRHLDLLLEAGGPLREMPIDHDSPARLDEDHGHFSRRVSPFESFAVESCPCSEIVNASAEPLQVKVRREARIRLDGPNFLRLGDWEMALIDRGGNWGEWKRVAPMPLANQLAKTGFSVTPDFSFIFGLPPVPSIPRLLVGYRARFENDYSGLLNLLMEPDSLEGEWKILVNGGAPITASDFARVDHPIRGYLAVDISSRVKPGWNEIAVKIETSKGDDGLRNPLYLAGDFGVAFGENRLTPFQEHGRIEAYAENGLPYFSGALSYLTSFELNVIPETEEVWLDLGLGNHFRESCEISINGTEPRAFCWEPRLLRVPRSLLLEGENRVDLRVFTSLSRLFEGQAFDETAHAYRDSTEKMSAARA